MIPEGEEDLVHGKPAPMVSMSTLTRIVPAARPSSASVHSSTSCQSWASAGPSNFGR